MITPLSKAEGRYFFCAITGMRVSEAVAIEIDKHIETTARSFTFGNGRSMKHVSRVKEHLKTESGCRDVDIHPDAAAILRNFIGSRKGGFLFLDREEHHV